MKRLYTLINTALFCSFCAQTVMAETHSTCYKTRTGIIISKENNQIEHWNHLPVWHQEEHGIQLPSISIGTH